MQLLTIRPDAESARAGLPSPTAPSIVSNPMNALVNPPTDNLPNTSGGQTLPPHPGSAVLRTLCFGWMLVSSALTCTGAAGTSPAASASDLGVRRDATVSAVERVIPSVVNIGTETLVASRSPLDDLFREFFDPYYREREADSAYSVGSGVIIDEEGHILTNHHVVSRAHRITVKLADGREYEAKAMTSTAFTDVALLKIVSKPGEKFSAVKFAGDDDLLLGETVIALGNPFGLGGSVSRGILSSKARRPPNRDEALDIPDWLQIDAAINPGNSGGPLINLNGELIGINVAVSRQGQGIGFAIPIKRISSTLSEMYTPETLGGFWFGARLRPQQKPTRVSEVEPGSPAALAGVKPGDVISVVDGKAAKSLFSVVDELVRIGDRREIPLLLLRGSERIGAKLLLVKEQSYFNADLVRKKLGVQVEELSAASAARIGLDIEGGLLVNAVDPRTPGAQANLQRGMIITSLSGQKMTRVGRAAKFLYTRAAGDPVQLELLIPIRRGRFIEVQTGSVEVKIR
jgi:serine protease Do